ncbi:MAG: hypothetical protein WD738_20810 [Pirellulales bacterium]
MSSNDATSDRVRHRGTWWQRFLIALLTVVLTALIYWLLGFVLDDIGTIPGPTYEEFEAARLDPVLRETAKRLTLEIADTEREINNQSTRQNLLRESTRAAQQTLGQLLEIQRLSIEQGTTLSDEQQAALAESQQLFLENQRRDQELSESRAALNERLVALQEEQRQNRLALEEARRPIQDEFNDLMDRHRLTLAAIKIAVLAPLWALGAWLFLRYRDTIYAPLVYALDVALVLKTFEVMHEYFPRRYFKYILIVAAIAAVCWILYRLLRLVARPSRDWRLRQYREAYQSFLCPICRYPIRRGPLRFVPWPPRSVPQPLVPSAESAALDPPYTCPSCATPLYEACAQCGHTRHALLPACEHCGAVKEI